jgi:hypothetical protein
MLEEWNDTIQEDANEFYWICEYLNQLNTPFGLFKTVNKSPGDYVMNELD